MRPTMILAVLMLCGAVYADEAADRFKAAQERLEAKQKAGKEETRPAGVTTKPVATVNLNVPPLRRKIGAPPVLAVESIHGEKIAIATAAAPKGKASAQMSDVVGAMVVSSAAELKIIESESATSAQKAVAAKRLATAVQSVCDANVGLVASATFYVIDVRQGKDGALQTVGGFSFVSIDNDAMAEMKELRAKHEYNLAAMKKTNANKSAIDHINEKFDRRLAELQKDVEKSDGEPHIVIFAGNAPGMDQWQKGDRVTVTGLVVSMEIQNGGKLASVTTIK